jgi:serine/threonine-protein kinase
MELQPGSVIGSYQISEEIGRGGRAVVYRAWQRTIGRWVALKVLHKRDPHALEDFRREAQFTANLGHAGVRQVYDAGQTPDGYPFLAMQFVDTSLRALLRIYEDKGQTFSLQEMTRLLEPVAGVLDHIHSLGCVHLDVKPENILLFKDGQVVLADFGSVRRIGSATHEGTPKYFSPEQAAGDRPVCPQSDVYSLAIVAYEMLTGQLPFGGHMDIVLVRQHLEETPRPLRQVNAHLPRSVEKTIAAALSKDPRQRPASARALLEQFRAGIESARSKSRPPLVSRLVNLRAGLGRWALLVPAAIVLIGLLLGGVFILPAIFAKPTPTSTPTSTPSLPPTTTYPPTPTPTGTATPTATPTETIAPTATPRPTSTPTPTYPPPTWTPTPLPEGAIPHKSAPLAMLPPGGDNAAFDVSLNYGARRRRPV